MSAGERGAQAWARDAAATASATQLEPPPDSSALAPPPLDADTDRGPRVMVVDDDQGFRSMIRDWLLDEGIEVVAEAEDGVVAVALAGERHPDIVLMDLQMPRMNGFEAARRIHAEQPGPQIIVLSAYGGPALKQAAEDAGVNWFVEKDCPPDVLWRTIRFAWTFKLDLEGRGAAAS